MAKREGKHERERLLFQIESMLIEDFLEQGMHVLVQRLKCLFT